MCYFNCWPNDWKNRQVQNGHLASLCFWRAVVWFVSAQIVPWVKGWCVLSVVTVRADGMSWRLVHTDLQAATVIAVLFNNCRWRHERCLFGLAIKDHTVHANGCSVGYLTKPTALVNGRWSVNVAFSSNCTEDTIYEHWFLSSVHKLSLTAAQIQLKRRQIDDHRKIQNGQDLISFFPFIRSHSSAALTEAIIQKMAAPDPSKLRTIGFLWYPNGVCIQGN